MEIVVINGLPSFIRKQTFNLICRKLLRKEKLKWYWIRPLLFSRDGETKQAVIEFNNPTEAHKAVFALDNFVFCASNKTYTWTAKHETDKSHPLYCTEEKLSKTIDQNMQFNDSFLFSNGRKRVRSPSLDFMAESSRIDHEILMLRKKRQLLEEERLLLLEEKKLEMVKRFGTDVLKNFLILEEWLNKMDDRKPPSLNKKPESKVPTPASSKTMDKGNTLPMFHIPCKKIMLTMKNKFVKCTATEYRLFKKLLLATLRRRLAAALEGKKYMNSKQILALYRTIHSFDSDKELIEELMKNVKDLMLVEREGLNSENDNDQIPKDAIDNAVLVDTNKESPQIIESSDNKEMIENELNDAETNIVPDASKSKIINTTDDETKSTFEKVNAGDKNNVIPTENSEKILQQNDSAVENDSSNSKNDLNLLDVDATAEDFINSGLEDWSDYNEDAEK